MTNYSQDARSQLLWSQLFFLEKIRVDFFPRMRHYWQPNWQIYLHYRNALEILHICRDFHKKIQILSESKFTSKKKSAKTFWSKICSVGFRGFLVQMKIVNKPFIARTWERSQMKAESLGILPVPKILKIDAFLTDL